MAAESPNLPPLSAPLVQKQIGTAVGMAVGLALTIAVFAWPAARATNVDRLSLWAACSTAAAAWLALAVGLQARNRFFSPADIDGAALSEASARAKLLQALIQNTLEQAALAVLAYAAWLLMTPTSGARTVALCAVLFSVGRLLFFAGYVRGAAARSLGFALTFYPTAGLLILSVPRALSGQIHSGLTGAG